jgi:hypothetical protein
MYMAKVIPGRFAAEMDQNPDIGFISTEFFLNWRGITLIQYWRSYEQLETYARGCIHLEAWKRFNQPGEYECIYGNMPRFGLAKAGDHIPAVGRMETSRRRMGGENNPITPTPNNPS